jgi:hypothetical protein
VGNGGERFVNRAGNFFLIEINQLAVAFLDLGDLIF